MNVTVPPTACFVNTFALPRLIRIPFPDLKAVGFPTGKGGEQTTPYNFEALQFISYKTV
jgi:hypothetical protein